MSYIDDLRQSFRPARITTLFVREATPHTDTFFHEENSKLFYAMQKVFGGGKNFLEAFKDSGFYLDDLVLEPTSNLNSKERGRLRRASTPSLAKRLSLYRPQAIVVVMSAIRSAVSKAIHEAGLTYEPFCTPFPACGNQLRFHAAMTQIIPSLPVLNTRKGKNK